MSNPRPHRALDEAGPPEPPRPRAAGRRQVALEELFCGLTDELVANGALAGDLQAETRWYNQGRRLCQGPSELRAVAVSRPMLEGCVRERVRALPVRVVDRCDAAGLVATSEGGRVRCPGAPACRRQRRGGARGRPGRGCHRPGSRSPIWLEELGYRRPPEDEVRIGMAYASRVYRRHPGAAVGRHHAGHGRRPLDGDA